MARIRIFVKVKHSQWTVSQTVLPSDAHIRIATKNCSCQNRSRKQLKNSKEAPYLLKTLSRRQSFLQMSLQNTYVENIIHFLLWIHLRYRYRLKITYLGEGRCLWQRPFLGTTWQRASICTVDVERYMKTLRKYGFVPSQSIDCERKIIKNYIVKTKIWCQSFHLCFKPK